MKVLSYEEERERIERLVRDNENGRAALVEEGFRLRSAELAGCAEAAADLERLRKVADDMDKAFLEEMATWRAVCLAADRNVMGRQHRATCAVGIA